jgi:hypothetical protein
MESSPYSFRSTPLSPILSVGDRSSMISNFTSTTGLLASTPQFSRFKESLEKSFSTIDLDSLDLFPDSDIDLTLHFPTTLIRTHASDYQMAVSAQPKKEECHRQGIFSRIANKILPSRMTPVVLCGAKDAGEDSDDDEMEESIAIKREISMGASQRVAETNTNVQAKNRRFTWSPTVDREDGEQMRPAMLGEVKQWPPRTPRNKHTQPCFRPDCLDCAELIFHS